MITLSMKCRELLEKVNGFEFQYAVATLRKYCIDVVKLNKEERVFNLNNPERDEMISKILEHTEELTQLNNELLELYRKYEGNNNLFSLEDGKFLYAKIPGILCPLFNGTTLIKDIDASLEEDMKKVEILTEDDREYYDKSEYIDALRNFYYQSQVTKNSVGTVSHGKFINDLSEDRYILKVNIDLADKPKKR